MTGCWRARRRRDGARSATSRASPCSSPRPPPTSSPAPPFPSTADSRSWDRGRTRGARVRRSQPTTTKSPGPCRGFSVSHPGSSSPGSSKSWNFKSWNFKSWARSVLRDHGLRPVELVVHADQELIHLQPGPNHVGGAEHARRHDKADVLAAEVHVVELTEHRPAGREHPFEAAADGPALA